MDAADMAFCPEKRDIPSADDNGTGPLKIDNFFEK